MLARFAGGPLDTTVADIVPVTGPARRMVIDFEVLPDAEPDEHRYVLSKYSAADSEGVVATYTHEGRVS